MLLKGSKQKVWWKCSKNHEWKASISDRVTKKSSCPFCANRKVNADNSLFALNPNIVSEWHPTLNGELTPHHVVPGSLKKVWWKCQNNHEWLSTVHHRVNRNQGCPYCSGRKVNLENSLYSTHPDLVKEWHPQNNIISPKKVTYGSTKKVWWKCSKNHEWQATVNSRTSNKNGCPYCANRKVCLDNCLLTTHPTLSNQWSYIKNGSLNPRDVMYGSTKKVWWVCSDGHEWQATINSRTRGSGCPDCHRLKKNKK